MTEDVCNPFVLWDVAKAVCFPCIWWQISWWHWDLSGAVLGVFCCPCLAVPPALMGAVQTHEDANGNAHGVPPEL